MKICSVLILILASCAGVSAQTVTNDNYLVGVGEGNGIKFWTSDAYKISMGNSAEYHYGPVYDYSIKTTMDDYTGGRGWTWGKNGQVPVAALSIVGHMWIAGGFRSNAMSLGTSIESRKFGLYDDPSDWYGLGIEGFRMRLQVGSSSARFSFLSGDTNELVTIKGDGNVGIGTASPDQKLTVNGTIHAKEVKIDLSVPAPDYVFADSYDLPSLEKVETYIDQNKHLPEVPSAVEMEKNGINVSEMNMLLLKKVEELTLYVIELKKRDQLQQEEIEQLKKK